MSERDPVSYAAETDARRALRLAAIDGDTARLVALLDAGVDVDSPDSRGWTPLMLTAKRGHQEAVRLLIDRGAAVNARNANGRTAIGYGVLCGHLGITLLLCERGADPDDGLACVPIRNTELLAFLLGHDGDPNRHADAIGYQVTYAAAPEDERAIQLLGAYGADPDAWSTSAGLFTPLMSAVFRRKTNIVRLLVELGVDVNARSKNRVDAPLALARRMRDKALAANRQAEAAESEAIVRLLVEAGATETETGTA